MANVDPIEPTTQQPISDDQELAKVLAGVSQQADDAADAGAGTTFDATAADATAPTVEPPVTDEATVTPAVDLTAPAVEPVTATPAPDLTTGLGTVPSAGGELDQIKQQALSEELLEQGWTDCLRHLHPGERIYTFWDYFRNAWGRDAGLRLDHLLIQPVSP